MKKIVNILKIIVLALPFILLALWLVYPNAYKIFYRVRIETVRDMQEQNKIMSQEPVAFGDSTIHLIAPLHSVAKNFKRYRFSQFEYDSAESRFINPLPKNDNFYIERGKNRFEVFCVPCHNHDGKGKGLMITKPILKADEEGFPQPADLTSLRTRTISDARIFHILSSGQNLMFPVNEKLSDIDKWCVINYIRYLQNKSN